MSPIGTKAKKSVRSNNNSQIKLVEAMNQFTETQRLSNDRFQHELTSVRQNIDEVKEMLEQFRVVSARRSRRGFLSRRNRSIPVEVVTAETSGKPQIRVDELLPLLPQLGGVIPQLNNPKVAETIKILSNPAVAAMIRQFMATNGLKGKAAVPAKRIRA